MDGTGGAAGVAGGGGTGGAISDDTESPSLSIDSEPSSEYETYIVSGAMTDNVGVTEISVRSNGGEPRTTIASGQTFGAFVPLEEGANLVEVTARDAAGNEARESISVAYVPNPNLPTPPIAGAPSSIDRIEQALADGDIDEETALLYRVYAIYSDDRLPVELRDGAGLIDATPILFDVSERLDSLSPQMQALIRPFLIPPIYAESAFNDNVASTVPKGLPDVCAATSDWTSIQTPEVRIWWNTLRRSDQAKAYAIKGEITDIWTTLLELMGRPPIKDDDPGIEHDGCSNQFDIYLDASYSGYAKVTPHAGHSGCDPWAASMTINPTEWMQTELKYVAAHELMHAFQLAYRTCLSNPSVLWWTEATAAWAVDHVYPSATDGQMAGEHFEHSFARKHYLPTLNQPIDGIGAGGFRPYGAYLWPFFLAGSSAPSKIPEIWEAVGKSRDRTVILAAMNSKIPNGFHGSFADFMLQVWNQDPVDDFKMIDLAGIDINPSDSMPKGVTEVSADLEGQVQRNIPLSLGVEPLAADFFHIKFDDPKVHTVLLSNGFTFEVGEGAIPDFPGAKDATVFAKRLTSEELEGKRVWALAKQNGMWSQKRYDLTDVAFAPFCQDVAGESIEELVLIFVNGRFADTQRSTPKGLEPRILISNMGCGDWAGTANVLIDENKAPQRTEMSHVNFSDLKYSRPESSLDDALTGRAQTTFVTSIIPKANLPGLFLGSSYALASVAANWGSTVNTLIGTNMCIGSGSGLFDETHVLTSQFLFSPYLSGSIDDEGSLYRSYYLQLVVSTMSNAVFYLCSDSAPFSQPFVSQLGGGYRQTLVGPFLVSQDGQNIKKEWKPDPDVTISFDLDATSSP